jgi:uncharacterized protein YbaP (TraB family)
MRRLLLLWTCLWLALGPLGCASAPPAAPRGVVAEAAERPQHPVFMWRTQSATAVVYLLGSIHVGSKDMYPLDPRIEKAFADSDTLVLEIDLDENAEADAAAQFVQMALLPEGRSLDDELDDETRARLHTRLDALEIPYENVRMFRPWFVAMTLEMQAMQAQGFSGDYGVDRHFREKAVGKKRILELESVEEQAKLFAQLTTGEELDDLRMALQDDDPETAMLSELTAQWRSGNPKMILDEVEETRRDYPDAYEALYAARNRKMTDKIEGYLATNRRYFVVAGGAHMVGDEGIVELLEKRGHEVVQE